MNEHKPDNENSPEIDSLVEPLTAAQKENKAKLLAINWLQDHRRDLVPALRQAVLLAISRGDDDYVVSTSIRNPQNQSYEVLSFQVDVSNDTVELVQQLR